MVDREELKRLRERESLYGQLIFAVENKIPGETRHETALRIIRQHENRNCGPERQDNPND